MDNQAISSTKKAFYKRWWFITLIIILAISVATAQDEEDLANEEADVSAEENENTEEDTSASSQNNHADENEIIADESEETNTKVNSEDENDKTEAFSPVNCKDFESAEQVYMYWTEEGYTSENDPMGWDGDSNGVPCEQLTTDIAEEFLTYEEEKTGNGTEENPADLSTTEDELIRYFTSYIEDEHDHYTVIENVRVNDNLSEDAESDTFIVLIDVEFPVQNTRDTGEDMMRAVSSDIAAHYANKGAGNVAEIAVFWTDTYHNRNLKFAYEYDDGAFYVMDEAIAN
ncbi:excalibur calcium-binding domain-containing protein [Bacillus daqingensis]|uniref:Excalibur calcium-binding domain-containing protein n=1 Tax=Bacillus daqingensis TaxID=872396 RepID=A0ABV9NXX4_9BACI